MSGIFSAFIGDNKKSKKQNSTYSMNELGSVLITGYPFIKNNNNTSTTTKN